MIPSVISLLTELSLKQGAREWLPMMTVLYMAQEVIGSGQCQSLLFLIVCLGLRIKHVHWLLSHLQEALQKNHKWQPRYRSGPRVALAPAIPFKFLDIGTKMGCYQLEGHIPLKKDTANVFHPRFIGDGIPPSNAFHAVMHSKVAKWVHDVDEWCLADAWFDHPPTFDFRVNDPPGYRGGLPVLVPTCPKKLFAQGPRHKYVDIVTDTLHASSSDLITWNTLVMMKLNWINEIPRHWIEIATHSLEAWKARDEVSPFLPDTTRGYARVTPVALSKVGIPNSNIFALSDYPLHGLGIYEDYESWERHTGYVWSTWTTKTAQPVHIDPALQAMIDNSLQTDSDSAGQTYHTIPPIFVEHDNRVQGEPKVIVNC